MDRVIKTKRIISTRVALLMVGVALAIVALLSLRNIGQGKKYNTTAQAPSVSNVSTEVFTEYIPLNAVVMPITSIYLDAIEGGRVEEKFVDDGAMLKKGDAIIKLVNTDLELSLANEQTAVYNVLTQMQNTKNIAEQNSINRQNNNADVDKDLHDAERVYHTSKKLFDDKVIAEQDFKAAENNYRYQLTRKKLANDNMRGDSISMRQQLQQMQTSYARMQHTLALMERKVNDLIVRAPVDGQLTSLAAEYGQLIGKGQRIGQVDVTSGYKLSADVDEFYLSRVFVGLEAFINVGNNNYPLRVSKVYSQVNNGRFRIDFAYLHNVPADIRRGQTMQVRLSLGAATKALVVKRGPFTEQTGGKWIYKLNDSGDKAYKVSIETGRENPEYIEILQGLMPGDKVIIGNYDKYGDAEQLILK